MKEKTKIRCSHLRMLAIRSVTPNKPLPPPPVVPPADAGRREPLAPPRLARGPPPPPPPLAAAAAAPPAPAPAPLPVDDDEDDEDDEEEEVAAAPVVASVAAVAVVAGEATREGGRLRFWSKRTPKCGSQARSSVSRGQPRSCASFIRHEWWNSDHVLHT
jgi:hypothetical protein